VISVDTKKKELVGNFRSGGREWQPTGTVDPVRVHECLPAPSPRAQRGLQLLFDDGLDGLANASSHPRLDRVRADRLCLAHRALPAIVLHRVILRHPPPSGRSS
jgi:hypothetical protein